MRKLLEIFLYYCLDCEGRGREMGTVHTARVKAAARRVNSGA